MGNSSVISGVSADELARELSEKHNGIKSGDGYKIKCPCHEDKTQSLSITARDGRLLLFCHAGCNYKDLIGALGLQRGLKAVKSNRTIVARYEYKDTDGTTAFEKIRYQPKEFSIRRYDRESGEWVFRNATKDAPRVLYKLPELLSRIASGHTALLCEGEKDADNLNALQLENYIATTNFEGAKTWRDEYTKQLTGAHVIIVQDNDEAGLERTKKVAAALDGKAKSVKVMKFLDLPHKGDASDWLATKPTKETIVQRLQTAEAILTSQWAAIEKASYKDYINYVLSLPQIRELRRDKLSDLCYARTKKKWRPVHNLEDYIRSHGRAYDCFDGPAFIEHLAQYKEDELEPSLLIDVPKWDGIDRIREIADTCKFSNVTSEDFYQLLCHFGAGIFQRIDNPQHQQPTLILQGPQGAGKDSLIKALFGHLDFYLKDLDLRPNREAEAIKQLHTAILFNIPEFDRTARAEIATLKYILSTASTDVRLSYDRTDEQRMVKASFISSCNIKNIIADHTGARRYWVINCDFLGFELVKAKEEAPPVGTGKILKDYPGLYSRPNYQYEQAHILAQFKHLYEIGFKAAQESITKIQMSVGSMVPESPEALLLAEYDEAISKINEVPEKRSSVDGEFLFTVSQLSEILLRLQKNYGYSRQKLLQILGSHGRRERSESRNLYRGSQLGIVEDSDSLPF